MLYKDRVEVLKRHFLTSLGKMLLYVWPQCFISGNILWVILASHSPSQEIKEKTEDAVIRNDITDEKPVEHASTSHLIRKLLFFSELKKNR